jgi:hypothetical protein
MASVTKCGSGKKYVRIHTAVRDEMEIDERDLERESSLDPLHHG